MVSCLMSFCPPSEFILSFPVPSLSWTWGFYQEILRCTRPGLGIHCFTDIEKPIYFSDSNPVQTAGPQGHLGHLYFLFRQLGLRMLEAHNRFFCMASTSSTCLASAAAPSSLFFLLISSSVYPVGARSGVHVIGQLTDYNSRHVRVLELEGRLAS